MMESPVMTVTELCEILRIHQTTMYRLIRRREVPYFKMGSDYRFNREQIQAWIRERENEGVLHIHGDINAEA